MIGTLATSLFCLSMILPVGAAAEGFQAPVKATQTVEVSGDFRLISTEVVATKREVVISVNGSGTLEDASKQFRSGYLNFNYRIVLRLTGERVDVSTSPTLEVALYRKGRRAGTAVVTGNIRLTGSSARFADDTTWVNVRGQGVLSGKAVVETGLLGNGIDRARN